MEKQKDRHTTSSISFPFLTFYLAYIFMSIISIHIVFCDTIFLYGKCNTLFDNQILQNPFGQSMNTHLITLWFL